jgi:hypothetical protein
LQKGPKITITSRPPDLPQGAEDLGEGKAVGKKRNGALAGENQKKTCRDTPLKFHNLPPKASQSYQNAV